MKERPILFSGPMVRAILEGRKTQTRRVIKPQPVPFIQYTPDIHPTTRTAPYIDAYCGERKTAKNPRGMSRDWYWWTADNRLGEHVARCPYGQPGDRLWVRETFADLRGAGFDRAFAYLADSSKKGYEDEESKRCRLDYGVKWKPSIHMPRIASRITLEITGVRVERLQDITEEDARAEGITDGGCTECGNHEPCGCANPSPDARDAFCFLWGEINGAESWAANPWVWVIEFKRL